MSGFESLRANQKMIRSIMEVHWSSKPKGKSSPDSYRDSDQQRMRCSMAERRLVKPRGESSNLSSSANVSAAKMESRAGL